MRILCQFVWLYIMNKKHKKVKKNKRSQRPGGTAKQGAIKNLHILTLYKPDKISVNSRLLTIMIFI